MRCTFEVRPPPESTRRARTSQPSRSGQREGSVSAPTSSSPTFSSADAPALEQFSISSAGPSSPSTAAPAEPFGAAPALALAATATATANEDASKRGASSERFAVARAEMTAAAETRSSSTANAVVEAASGGRLDLDLDAADGDKYVSAHELPARRCFYYEVQLVTGGVLQLGWCTKRSRFLAEEGHGVGDDFLSIGYQHSFLLLFVFDVTIFNA